MRKYSRKPRIFVIQGKFGLSESPINRDAIFQLERNGLINKIRKILILY